MRKTGDQCIHLCCLLMTALQKGQEADLQKLKECLDGYKQRETYLLLRVLPGGTLSRVQV